MILDKRATHRNSRKFKAFSGERQEGYLEDPKVTSMGGFLATGTPASLAIYWPSSGPRGCVH